MAREEAGGVDFEPDRQRDGPAAFARYGAEADGRLPVAISQKRRQRLAEEAEAAVESWVTVQRVEDAEAEVVALPVRFPGSG